ncbi:uncharacterized protein LODBEIA_P08080 [Lodderomyces beijingensis]|uniref:Bromodomain associated domain-containing protein n=1 Tax=Lodderomyces beijingensis TaxID=1775926 RepID=A0ABP0ZEI8_9ASCO
MEDSFNFSLLRIPIAQVLKASGFDKCKPSHLAILTDLSLHFMNELTQEAIKCSQVRIQSNSPEVQDVMQAMINIGFIKAQNPHLIHDAYFKENEQYNTKSIISFRDWFQRSYNFATAALKLNQVPQSLINALIEKRRLDVDDGGANAGTGTGESAVEKRKRKHKERQEFYNQLKLNDDEQKQAEEHHRKQEEKEEEEEEAAAKQQQQQQQQQHQQQVGATSLSGGVDGDGANEESKKKKRKMTWLNYLLEKDLKLGHDLKFLNANEFILDEFLKFQDDKDLHPAETTKADLDEVVAESEKNDYIVSEIPKPRDFEFEYESGAVGGASGGGVFFGKEKMRDAADVNADLWKSEENLKAFLPYNVKYPEELLSDELDVVVEGGGAGESSPQPLPDELFAEPGDVISGDLIMGES